MKLRQTVVCGALAWWSAGVMAIEVHQAAPIRIAPSPPPSRIVEAASPNRQPNPNVEALVAQGTALAKEGRLGDAVNAYSGAIAADPRHEGARFNRGLAYARMGQGNLRLAHDDFSKVIELNPNNERAYYNRALVNRDAGRERYFREDLKRAAQLGHARAQAYLGSLVARTPPENGRSAPANGADAQMGSRGGNAVEPISNGIVFAMTGNEIRQRFGDPGRKAGFPSCVMNFGSFTVETCYGGQVSRLYLGAPGVTLNSGIGVGSGKADVARVFGNPYGTETGPYKIDIRYNGDRVANIKVDYHPASGGSQGAASGDRARNNHYSNMQNLQNRMDQSGTIGYNPFRNQ